GRSDLLRPRPAARRVRRDHLGRVGRRRPDGRSEAATRPGTSVAGNLTDRGPPAPVPTAGSTTAPTAPTASRTTGAAWQPDPRHLSETVKEPQPPQPQGTSIGTSFTRRPGPAGARPGDVIADLAARLPSAEAPAARTAAGA